MLEDLMKIYEAIALRRDEVMKKCWRYEDLKIHMLIKLGMCVEFGLHMKNKTLEDWCS